MQRSKLLISQALKTIRGNMERTGDPLGLKTDYWTHWAEGLGLPRRGPVILYTARMYQMLPYLVQATGMTEKARPLIPALSSKTAARAAEIAGTLAADPVLRMSARRSKRLRDRTDRLLAGICSALAAAGTRPAYLYEKEPYSGVLLYDLGMESSAASQARSVYRTLKSAGAETVVTVDPHTTFMLRQVFSRYIPGFDLNVRHYLEVLAASGLPGYRGNAALPRETPVLHDSCVMTRDLGIVAQTRTVLEELGIRAREPENTGINTACCGGPVEYAYAELSRSVSRIRAEELAGFGRDVLVSCPICLVNLMKHENELGIRVHDMGEILNPSFDS